MITEQEAKQRILDDLHIGTASVTQAKEYVVEYLRNHPLVAGADTVVDNILCQLGATRPGRIDLDEDFTLEASLRQVSEYLTWTVSLCEAIWSLVHAGVIIRFDPGQYSPHFSVSCYTRRSGSGLDFPEVNVQIPARFRLAPTVQFGGREELSDADLYLGRLSIPDLDPAVTKGLREAISCFRGALYTPCVVMLGHAVEAAYGELGLSLANFALSVPVSERGGPADNRLQSLKQEIDSSDITMFQLIDQITKMYDSHQVFERVRVAVSLKDVNGKTALRYTRVWADQVRDARNIIHPRRPVATPNTHENVAILLMATRPSLRAIYTVRSAALQLTT